MGSCGLNGMIEKGFVPKLLPMKIAGEIDLYFCPWCRRGFGRAHFHFDFTVTASLEDFI
jgi:hypothetical protein